MLRQIPVLLLAFIFGACAKPASPEESVLAYFAAAKAGDKPAFKALVTGRIAEQSDQAFAQLSQASREGEIVVSIEESVPTGPAAHEVKFRFEMNSNGAKVSGSETVQLEKRDGRWLLAERGTARDSSAQVEADSEGKKPQHLVGAYFDALNADDFDAVFALYTPGHYAAETTQAGQPDPERLARHIARIAHKTESHSIDHAHCGFHKNNAPGVYSVAVNVTLTDAYLEDRKARGMIPLPKSSGSELCFKLSDGRWRITSKLKGE